jgi:hypothetical protein
MPIQIERTAAGYFAVVTPWPSFDVTWANDVAMRADDLISALQSLGLHQQDIGDAFQEADPGWLEADR